MKWNCFDWFDHYAAEKNGVPKLETQPIHTDAIWKRVQEQAGIAPQPKRNRMHMTKCRHKTHISLLQVIHTI